MVSKRFEVFKIEHQNHQASIQNYQINCQKSAEITKKVNIDTALEATGFGKFNYVIITITGVLLTQLFLENLALGFVLPVTDCDLHLTTYQKGVICAAEFLGIIISSHFWGFLGDTKGRRRVIRPSIFAAFLTNILSSFLSNFWPLVIVRFFNGFFVSAGCSIPLAYLGEFHTDKLRAKAIMITSVVYGLTSLIMPSVSWLVINQSWKLDIPFINITYKPWRLFFVVTGLPELICGLCLFVVPESPKFTLLQNNQKETLETLRKMFAMNTGKDANEYPYNEILQEETSSQWISDSKTHPVFGIFQLMWRQTVPLFQKTLRSRTVLICAIRFLIFITTNGMYMWFPKILNNIGEFRNREPNNKSRICEIIELNKLYKIENQVNGSYACKETLEISVFANHIILEFCYVLLFIVISFILKYVGKVKVLFLMLFAPGVCGIISVFIDIPLLATALYLLMMFCGLSAIVLNIVIVDLFPTSLRAMAGSVTFVVGCMGSILGTNLIGTLLEIKCEGAFIFAAGCLIISAFLAIFIWSIEKSSIQKNPKLQRKSIVSISITPYDNVL